MKPPGARALVATLLLLAAGACASRSPAPPPVTAPTSPAPRALRVRVEGRVVTVALEDYVAGCVVAELGSLALSPAAAARAREVQAIVCRSYALGSAGRHSSEGFDLCSTTHCQVYRPAPDTAIGRLAREAAGRTSGLVLLFDGRPVVPVYHADCGGRTSAGSDVWGGPPVPYLAAVKDDVCARRPAWRFEVEIGKLAGALARAGEVNTGRLKDVRVERRDGSGRAASVRLEGASPESMRGTDFRAAVVAAFGAATLKSTLFTVRRHGRTLVFEGRGNGHGVGLCQSGLVARAGRGEGAAAILAYYFPGTSVGRR